MPKLQSCTCRFRGIGSHPLQVLLPSMTLCSVFNEVGIHTQRLYPFNKNHGVQLLPFHMPLCSGVWCYGQLTSTSLLNGRGVRMTYDAPPIRFWKLPLPHYLRQQIELAKIVIGCAHLYSAVKSLDTINLLLRYVLKLRISYGRAPAVVSYL